MSILERIPQWEKCSLDIIASDLIELGYSCTINLQKHNCESGKWIDFSVWNDTMTTKITTVSGSRLGIVRERLIKWIDKQGIRDFLKEK